MRKFVATAFVASLLTAGAARAQAPAASGFSLGLRAGYGIPIGNADGGDPALGVPAYSLSDLFSGQVPLQVDAMYRLDKHWSLGLYFQYGLAFAGTTTCDSLSAQAGVNLDCSGTDLRFGGQLHYRFDSQGFLPWVGFGIGGEWATFTAKYGGASFDLDLSGFEFLNLQAGGDWLLSPTFRMGPYVQFSFSQYDTITAGGTSGSISNKTVHEWLQLGVKGTFDF